MQSEKKELNKMSRTAEKYGAVFKHSNIWQMEVSEKEEKEDGSKKYLKQW